MKLHSYLAIACAAAMFCACNSSAPTQEIGTGNPYLPLWEHLPDGEPRVFEDPDNPGKFRAYIIGSHDLRVGSYCGPDIRMWSAPVEDLTAWVDEGPIFTYNIDDQWDVMYAPDLVEVHKRDGKREYYLYPHSRGWGREALVAKSDRPDGPFTVINATEDGRRAVDGSILGFDPSVFVEQIDDPNDPDYEIGFRAYGYWGFQRSSAVELDQNTMYSARPGGTYIPYFIPASFRYGVVRQVPGVKEYPALYKDQKPEDFNFFEASSIRKVGNKYVMIFSGYSGPDYGLGSSNSTLRYAYGDSPLGPWRSGGVLVDSRGIVLNEDGSALIERNAAHNTHGSIEKIGDQWYAFYHRPPRGFGFARQPMVAPVTIQWDETPVAEGGQVVIRGYDPYAEDGIWDAKASNGAHYTGAEVTSEGFQIFGMPPYKYYSAGYACFLSDIGSQQDNWDLWDNSMPVNVSDKDIVGYKYFGFGGLAEAQKGLKPFEGTAPGNGTSFNVFLTPKTDKAFKINVWLDGPWANEAWKGTKIGEINVPAGSAEVVTKFTIDVADAVDNLDKKHAIYLVAEGEGDLCELMGLGFSKKGQKMTYPAPPAVTISVDGNALEMPKHPVRSTNENGYVGYDKYEVSYTVPAGQTKAPKVTAKADNKAVQIEITQPESVTSEAVVKCSYNGVVKTYTVKLSE